MEELVAKLRVDYPEFNFVSGRKFAFRYPRTIKIGPREKYSELLLLHELGHAILGHCDFRTDIERLKMETEAWEKARELSKKYEVLLDDEVIENELDSYRDWLHKKSRCSSCGLTRFQDTDGTYYCPRCEEFKKR